MMVFSLEVASIFLFLVWKKSCHHDRFGRSYHDFGSVVMIVDLVDRNTAILNLVREWHVVRLWMQCLVTWICTNT